MFGHRTPRHPQEPTERHQGALIARASVLADQLAQASQELSQVVRDLQDQTDHDEGAQSAD